MRRDLEHLVKRGYLERTHGGAVLVPPALATFEREPSITAQLRRAQRREWKKPGLSGGHPRRRVARKPLFEHSGPDNGDPVGTARRLAHAAPFGHAGVGDLVNAALRPRGRDRLPRVVATAVIHQRAFVVGEIAAHLLAATASESWIERPGAAALVPPMLL